MTIEALRKDLQEKQAALKALLKAPTWKFTAACIERDKAMDRLYTIQLLQGENRDERTNGASPKRSRKDGDI